MHKSLLTRREWLAAASGLAAGSAARRSQAAAPGDGAAQLDQLFQNPPLSARPSCYWLWLNDYTDKDQLTRELDEFQAKGLSGGYIFDIGARDPEGIVPVGPAYLSDESLEAIAHVTREATRRGMELGIVTSSSWNSGGPWVTPEHAGKGLYLS